MEKVYAEALWHVMQDGRNPMKAVSQLHQLLVRRGHTGLIRRIARAFSIHAEHERKRTVVNLLIAHKEDETRARKEIVGTLTELRLMDRPVKTHVDHTLIGGWCTEGREHLVDASYKKFLLEIYSNATNN
jgi:F0F1-type ATP synthase delta subunit